MILYHVCQTTDEDWFTFEDQTINSYHEAVVENLNLPVTVIIIEHSMLAL